MRAREPSNRRAAGRRGAAAGQLYDWEGEINDAFVAYRNAAVAFQQNCALLDVEEPLPGSYTLEVSSPGLDRPLRTLAHFERFVGHEAKIRLGMPIEGRRNFKGRLCGIEDKSVVIDVDGTQWHLPLDDVVAAHLVPEF